MAVVLISADLEELIGMSDRLLVMLRGSITAELDPQKTTPEQLGSAMTGASPALRKRSPKEVFHNTQKDNGTKITATKVT